MTRSDMTRTKLTLTLTLTAACAASLLMAGPASAALIELTDPLITGHADEVNNTHVAENVFDDDLGTSYIVDNSPQPRIDFDFGVATKITGFDFNQRHETSSASGDVDAFDLIFGTSE